MGEALYQGRHYVQAGDFVHAGEISTQLKNALKKLGFPQPTIRRASIASYEAEINLVIHSKGGWFQYRVELDRIEFIVRDVGPGIENLDLAMKEGWSTATSEVREMGFGAGMGLPNIKRNSDRFRITSGKGAQTVLEFRINVKWPGDKKMPVYLDW